MSPEPPQLSSWWSPGLEDNCTVRLLWPTRLPAWEKAKTARQYSQIGCGHRHLENATLYS